jgi:hypothetical protein
VHLCNCRCPATCSQLTLVSATTSMHRGFPATNRAILPLRTRTLTRESSKLHAHTHARAHTYTLTLAQKESRTHSHTHSNAHSCTQCHTSPAHGPVCRVCLLLRNHLKMTTDAQLYIFQPTCPLSLLAPLFPPSSIHQPLPRPPITRCLLSATRPGPSQLLKFGGLSALWHIALVCEILLFLIKK